MHFCLKAHVFLSQERSQPFRLESYCESLWVPGQQEACGGCTQARTRPARVTQKYLVPNKKNHCWLIFNLCLNPRYTSYQQESLVMECGSTDFRCHSTGAAAGRHHTASCGSCKAAYSVLWLSCCWEWMAGETLQALTLGYE